MGLIELLAIAFIGGLALNLSPCILPVISLKILSFIKQSQGDWKVQIKHGLLYGLGIMLSFSVLAGLTIGVKASGGSLLFGSWALESTAYNMIMALIMTVLGLYTLGFFQRKQA